MMQDARYPLAPNTLRRPRGHGWDVFLWELHPAIRAALIRSRLREVHLHGWTIAVPAEHMLIIARRRDELEAALTRAHGGSPKCVHLVELGK